ncbi:retropepsin-like aspartic protease family protein [Candidatus Odyssella thessalonicensis]|uniref:retropepsin-like aspartic protease family protein n=1 Tax=Candidatus Odyssella thessalonicensis TaxID=84647 RepID=UPI000225B43F|nr:TIGR02281 family clan AA aspartic protease [Candidatus Odyssella thessalonicensis]
MTNRRNLMIVLGIIGILFIGWLNWQFPHALTSSDSIADIIWCVVILGALIPSLASQMGASQAAKYATIWGSIFIVFLIGYSFREDLHGVSDRIKSNLFPYAAVQTGNAHISFTKAVDGHFYIEAEINHTPVLFMVDTGATRTTLTLADAKRLGVDVENLSYNEPIHTASGMDFVATTQLTDIKVGDLTLMGISASVSKNLKGHSLLGMNFLKKLKGFTVEGNRLTLQVK